MLIDILTSLSIWALPLIIGLLFLLNLMIEVAQGRSIASFFSPLKAPRTWASKKIMRYESGRSFLGLVLGFAFSIPERTQLNPKNFNILFWVGVIGILLYLGLILFQIRWKGERGYFPLYYYFTLIYALPFSYTLHFLYGRQTPIGTLLWLLAMILLALLVERAIWLALLCIGTVMGTFVVYLTSSPEVLILQPEFLMSFLCGMFFTWTFIDVKKKALRAANQRQKIWINEYIHDVKLPMYETQVAAQGLILQLEKNVKSVTRKGKKYRSLLLEEEAYDYLFTENITMHKAAFKKLNQQMETMGYLVRHGQINPATLRKGSAQGFLKEAFDLLPKGFAQQLHVNINSSSDFVATLNTTLLGNVLTNLIKNADKHGKATQVEIGCDASHREIYIKDNGKGVPRSVQPYLFDLHSPIHKKGIGIPFIRNIVTLMGGYIRFTTSPEGTTFFIGFPQAPKT